MATTVAPTRPGRNLDVGWAALLTAVLVLSLGSTISKKVGAPGLTLACVRSFMGCIVWQVILAARGRHLTFDSLRISAGPGVLFGVNIACFFTAVQHTRVANVEFLGALGPLVVVPAGALFFHEHIPWKALVWGLPAIGGVGLVAFLAERSPKESNAFGLLMAVASIFTWAAYLLLAKRLRPRIEIGEFMAGTALAAGVILLPFSLAQGFVSAIPARGWPWLLLLTLCNAVIAHTLLLVAQQHVAVGTISTMQVAQPALAAAAAWVLLGEHVNGGQVVGMVIVLSSLALYSLTVQRGAYPWQSRR
jgi:drug/metabolite transporter (DMT)-like permease